MPVWVITVLIFYFKYKFHLECTCVSATQVDSSELSKPQPPSDKSKSGKQYLYKGLYPNKTEDWSVEFQVWTPLEPQENVDNWSRSGILPPTKQRTLGLMGFPGLLNVNIQLTLRGR